MSKPFADSSGLSSASGHSNLVMHSHGSGEDTNGSGTEQRHQTEPELQSEVRSIRSDLDALTTRLDKQAAQLAAQAAKIETIVSSTSTIATGAKSSAQYPSTKGKSKGYMGPTGAHLPDVCAQKGSKGVIAKGRIGKANPSPMTEVLTVERAQGLPHTVSHEGGPVAYQLALGMPWRTFGPNGETFEWNNAGKDAVDDDAKSAAKALLQTYADEHRIPLYGRSMTRIALKQRGFWISFRGGVAHAANSTPPQTPQSRRGLASQQTSSDSETTDSHTDEADDLSSATKGSDYIPLLSPMVDESQHQAFCTLFDLHFCPRVQEQFQYLDPMGTPYQEWWSKMFTTRTLTQWRQKLRAVGTPIQQVVNADADRLGALFFHHIGIDGAYHDHY